VIAFTYPHIGNYGTNPDDDESRRPFCTGVIVRDLARRSSSWRSTETLADFLVRRRVPGITGIDTRRLTRHLRDAGAVPGAFGTDEAAVRAAAAVAPATDGVDLVRTVTTDAAYTAGDPDAPFHVVAYDLGIKRTIRVTTQAAAATSRSSRRRPRTEQVLERNPTASSSRTVPVTRSRAPRRRCSRLVGIGSRSSASASVTRSSGSRSAGAR
jgi:carbamoyl-phosphate synthase small subunit